MNKFSPLAFDWTWAGEKFSLCCCTPVNLMNITMTKTAQALMIAFGLRVETENNEEDRD